MEQGAPNEAELPASDILTQLAALTALVQAQGDEIARLKAASTSAAGPSTTAPANEAAHAARAVTSSAPSKVGRRGWVRQMVGATAAAALLTVGREAATAEAATRTTVLPNGSTTQYGLVASNNIVGSGESDFIQQGGLPLLGGHRFGMVGALVELLSLPTASAGAGVFGLASQAAGVFGMSNFLGVRGETPGNANSASGVFGLATATTGRTVGTWGESRSNTNQATGVFGLATAPTGRTVGAWGETRSTTGQTKGVFGIARGAIGRTYGVWGQAESATSGAAGVVGLNTATAGATFGVSGQVSSTGNNARGVTGYAIGSTGRTYGVHGRTDSSTDNASGVKGEASAGTTVGVWGENASTSPNATGVLGLTTYGSGASVAVWGRSQSVSEAAVGVYGQLTESDASGTAVRGDSPRGYGVRGDSSSGIALYGLSGSGTGAWGQSTIGYGVVGQSTSGIGVSAVSSATDLPAVYGQNNGTGPAGQFIGDVTVQGNFTVIGGAKSAAVPLPDGSHARVYCQESPEPWFEDFGEAQLANGRAVVDLDPKFDAVIKGDDYQIFLTAYADLGTLYIEDRRPHRFVVRSDKGATAAGAFGYRVVGRRRDLAPGRLKKVGVPKAIDPKSLTAPTPSRPVRPSSNGEPNAVERVEAEGER